MNLTCDALTATGVYEDDGRVVSLLARKVYPDDGEDALPVPGAVIRVEAL
jgi:Holliday junction resolvase RusA-like endonuclease